MAISRGIYLLLIFLLLALMFGLGATLTFNQIIKVLKHPRGIFIGIASQFGWMPLIACAMVFMFGWAGEQYNDGVGYTEAEALTGLKVAIGNAINRTTGDYAGLICHSKANSVITHDYVAKNHELLFCMKCNVSSFASVDAALAAAGAAGLPGCPAADAAKQEVYLGVLRNVPACKFAAGTGFSDGFGSLALAYKFLVDYPTHKILFAITLVLQGCTPGGSTSNMYTYFSRGDVALSVTMTVCSTTMAFGMMPLLLMLYGKLILGISLDAMKISDIIMNLTLVLLPVAAGAWCRVNLRRIYADRIVSIGSFSGFVVIFIVIGTGLADEENQMMLSTAWNDYPHMYTGSIALGVIGMFLGYSVSRLLGERPRQARTISFETGIQNGPLTIAIATAAFEVPCYQLGRGLGDIYALGVPLLYSLFVSITSPLIMIFYREVLGAAREDLLWDDRPEYRFLYQESLESFMTETVPVKLKNKQFLFSKKRAMAFQPSGLCKKKWKSWNYVQYYSDVTAISKAFITLGLEPGKAVSILGYNCPMWFMSEMATVFAGGIGAGIYTTSTPEQIVYIVNHSESQIVCVDGAPQLQKVLDCRFELDEVKAVVCFFRPGEEPAGLGLPKDKDGNPGALDLGEVNELTEDAVWADEFMTPDPDRKDEVKHLYFWDELLEMGQAAGDEVQKESDSRIKSMGSNDVCTLIYTSGTTGPPKAVMITHRNVMFVIGRLAMTIKLSPDDHFVSYLPLSHIAEKATSLFGSALFGMCTWFANCSALKGTLVVTLNQVNPTVFFGVPRVWEKIEERMKGMRNRPVYAFWCIPTGKWGIRQFQKLSSWAKKIGLKANYALQDGRPMPKNFKLATELIFVAVKNALGLGRARYCASAAAPISLATLEYFMQLNIRVQELYGLSETTGPVTWNQPGAWKVGTVGQLVNGMEMKLGDDDELLFRGPCIMKGYMKNEKATEETIDAQKWLHTGDIGKKDAHGFVRITDRKKEILITAGGENVAPSAMEGFFRNIAGVSQAVMIGDKQKFLVALFTLEQDVRSLNQLLGTDAKDAARMSRDKVFQEWFDKQCAEVNSKFPNAWRVKKYIVLPFDFKNEGANAELTATLKLKRRIIVKKYEKQVKRLYGDDWKEYKSGQTGKGSTVSRADVKLFAPQEWKAEKLILTHVILTADGKQLLVKGNGLPLSVDMDLDGDLIESNKSGKFLWLYQFSGSIHTSMPAYTQESITEDKDYTVCKAIVNGIAKLVEATAIEKGPTPLIYDQVIGTKDPNVNLVNVVTVVKNGTPADKVLSADFKSGAKWINAPENKYVGSHVKDMVKFYKNYKKMPKGLYVGYLCAASTKRGFQIVVDADIRGMVPFVRVGDIPMQEDFMWWHGMRARARAGKSPILPEGTEPVSDDAEDANFPQAFERAVRQLRAKYNLEEDQNTLLESMYDIATFKLDNKEEIQMILFTQKKVLSVAKLPKNFGDSARIVPMNMFEPPHFGPNLGSVYDEFQQEILALNRDVREVNHRISIAEQNAEKIALRKQKTELTRRFQKETKRWDFMRWPLKTIDWMTTLNKYSIVDRIPKDEQAAEGVTLDDTILKALQTVDGNEIRELEAHRVICNTLTWESAKQALKNLGQPDWAKQKKHRRVGSAETGYGATSYGSTEYGDAGTAYGTQATSYATDYSSGTAYGGGTNYGTNYSTQSGTNYGTSTGTSYGTSTGTNYGTSTGTSYGTNYGGDGGTSYGTNYGDDDASGKKVSPE